MSKGKTPKGKEICFIINPVSRLSFKSLIIIVLFLLIPIVFLLRLNQKGSTVLAEWWNDSWSYRQAINISSHSVGETNVYIIATVNIGSTAKAQADDGDFRFTDATGSLLDYYLASGAGTTAPVFHILIPSFPAGASTYYAYYGNASVTNGFLASGFSTQASNYTIGSYSSEETGGGPIAWWKFDEGVGTTTYDSSGHSNSGAFGTGSSAPTWTDESQCVTGKCLKFDGSNDYVSAANNNSLDLGLNESKTISAWINIKEAKQQRIVAKYLAGEGGYSFLVRSDNSLRITTNDGAGTTYQAISINTLTLNNWYYVTGIITAGDKLKIYINGKEVSYSTQETYVSDDLSTTNPFRIGTREDLVTDYFNGSIDDVKIYPYSRTAAQIKKDYASGLAGMGSAEGANVNVGSKSAKGLSDGLVGYWKFDEGVGTTSADSSGNSNLATFAAGTSAPIWNSGKFGIGTSFDGNDDYVSTNLDISTNDTNLTMSAWIYWSGDNIEGHIVEANTMQFFINSSNVLQFYSGTAYTTTQPTIATNVWTHVVAVCNSIGHFIYVNGTLASESTNANTCSITGTTTFIGNYFGTKSYAFNGSLDEVRIYNRALSSDDVKALYNYAPGPVAYWDFNEGTGTTAYDSSGNSRNASLLNGANFAPGKFGKALNLNVGTTANQYATFSQINHNFSFTKEAWIYPTATTGCGSENRCSVIGPYFEVLTNLQYYDYSMVALPGWHSGGSIPLNRWSHVAVSYDQSNVKLFVNGIQVYNTAVGSTNSHSSNIIGAAGSNSRNFRGQIDEVKIYDYARTQQQIISDMNAGSSPVSSGRGAIAYYKFDEGRGSTTANWGIGGTALNGTLGSGSSSPTWTNGKVNKSLNFEGDGDVVNLGNNLPTMTEGSISMWVNRTSSTATYQMLFTDASSQFEMCWNNTTNLQFYVNNTAVNTTSASSLNTWFHLVGTFSQTENFQKLYVNGNMVASGTYPGDATAATRYLGSRASSYLYTGLIDEVKIYNYALSSDEVKTDYNAGASFVFGKSAQTIGATTTSLDYCIPGDTTACSAPVTEWKMDKKTGVNVYDTSGNGNTGTVTNATWTNGKIGAALNFDGNGDYVVSATNPSTSQVFTTSFWFNTSTPSTNMYLLDRGGNIHWFELYNSKLRSGTSASNYSDSTTTILANTWYFATMTYDGTNVKQYINGIQQFNVAGGNVAPSGLQLSRYYNGGTYFNGKINQVRIYNYARTPAQVAYDYNKGGPVGWWKMDECQGTQIADWSGNANHGTLSIGASGTQNSVGTCSVGTSAA